VHPVDPRRLLDAWLATQATNVTRHAASLRAFAPDEFGSGPAAPSAAHVRAVNRFVEGLRGKVAESARWVDAAVRAARRTPGRRTLEVVLDRKTRVSAQVLYVEGIWDFYFDLFVQRLSSFGERLRAVDRIAAGCYEDLYTGLGSAARPTPALLPFSYADSGFSPATFRRGVPLTKLRHHPNLFPLITLPQHRLDNVWALSSVLHEVSHNLQADLGLWEVMPGLLHRRLTREARLPDAVGRLWAQWHKEMTADLFALLLGGPSAVESLMDVVGRARAATVRFDPHGVHPTPYLRVLISLTLLRRMGFPALADGLERAWRRLYPDVGPSLIPEAVLRTFPRAAECAVDTVCYQPHPQLGGKPLAQVLTFGAKEQAMVESAAARLARGDDPGATPLRFMIGAARHALDHRLASPRTLTDNFYRTLGRR
jgi:hypothetical protein